MATPRLQRLFLRLYASFLVLTIVGGLAAGMVLHATSRRPGNAGPNWGTRLAFHLSRTLSGISDDNTLRDTLQGAHDDLDVDLVVLTPDFKPRASGGAPFATPPQHLLDRARKGPAWLPPPFGIVAAPMDDKRMLVVRFPGPSAQRRTLRWTLMILAGLACTTILLYPLSRSITRPLEQLTVVARRFGEGDLSARARIDRRDEVGQLANTFDEMAGRIQAARRAERELLANVSHELRTPLARIQVALALLAPRDEKDRARAQMIGEEVEELGRLIGDVLTTSKLELSAQPLQKRELVARDLAEKARERALALEPLRDIQVEVPQALVIDADEGLIGRVLDNLVDNARKYDPSGKPIRIEGRREGADVLLAVQDNGPGIPESDLASVFEPFFRGGNARSNTSGFGLGLALARRVAEAHGGSIRALNGQGGGARLELRVPAKA